MKNEKEELKAALLLGEADSASVDAIIAEKSEEKLRKLRKAQLIKLGIILVFAAIVVVFMTIAWFSMSREVGTGGMSIKSQAGDFNLRVGSGSTGEIGFNELYRFLDSSLTGNSGTITNESAGGQVISWRFVNGDDMLMPGSQGVLEFDVISNGGSVENLNYKLVISGYDIARSHIETDNTDPDNPIDYEVIDELNEINTSNGYSGTIIDSVSYLNSHILFFTGRNGSSEADYTYYGFINDKDTFELTLNNGTGRIYWIWPNTLGQIALDAADTNYISGVPVLYFGSTSYTEDRAALKTYMKNNQAGVFRGSETSYSSLIDDLYSKRALGQSYKTEFDKLSDGYNSADQEIGNNIDYVLVHMIANMQ